MSKLSARLEEAKGDRSIDAIVAKAEREGHKIDRATVARYVAGDHAKNPRDSVLRALAAGLDLDVRELRTLAGRPAGELGPYVPVDEAARLNADQRRAIDALIKTIVAAAPAATEPAAGPEPTVAAVREAQERHLRAVALEGDQGDEAAIDDLARRARLEQTGREE